MRDMLAVPPVLAPPVDQFAEMVSKQLQKLAIQLLLLPDVLLDKHVTPTAYVLPRTLQHVEMPAPIIHNVLQITHVLTEPVC